MRAPKASTDTGTQPSTRLELWSGFLKRSVGGFSDFSKYTVWRRGCSGRLTRFRLYVPLVPFLLIVEYLAQIGKIIFHYVFIRGSKESSPS